jgi:hypothetical protein
LGLQSVVDGVRRGRPALPAELIGPRRVVAYPRDVRRRQVTVDESRVALTLAHVGTVAVTALDTLKPSLVAEARASGATSLLTRGIAARGRRAQRTAAARGLLRAPALAPAAAVAALAPPTDRRRTMAALGAGAAVAAVTIVVVLVTARNAGAGAARLPTCSPSTSTGAATSSASRTRSTASDSERRPLRAIRPAASSGRRWAGDHASPRQADPVRRSRPIRVPWAGIGVRPEPPRPGHRPPP